MASEETRALRVLVVEDEPDIRTLIRFQLEAKGHAVVEAGDGGEGLAAAAVSHPDVIVTDLAMPNMSGTDLIRALRSRSDELATVPIVVFTAFSKTSAEFPELAAQHVRVLHKPMDLRQIANIAEQMAAPVQQRQTELAPS